MYRIPIPVGFFLSVLLRTVYDREAGLSSDRVNPASIRNNATIILGKQIIQILPEGSAILNPGHSPFCLNETHKSVELPIQINQTEPTSIEITRIDLESHEEEVYKISAKQARQLKKRAEKLLHKLESNSPITLRYEVSKTGLYELTRVVDKSGLDVRLKSMRTAVVTCPKAMMSATQANRCIGELSNLALQVAGVPPFVVKYSKRINMQTSSSITQTIRPPDMDSPLGADQSDQALLNPAKPFLDWTRSMQTSIEVNEALDQNGTWSYGVEEVSDGFGNFISYDLEGSEASRSHQHIRSLVVHNRPRIALAGCNAENPIRTAKGQTESLPLRLQPGKQIASQDWPVRVRYTFAAEDDPQQGDKSSFGFEMPDEHSVPKITQPGVYTIESVESQFCSGAVTEPSTCILSNPPLPDVTVEKEDMIDTCAGSPIGVRLNFDFTGTPPFRVRYVTTHRGKQRTHTKQFQGHRGQLELKEPAAGSYEYEILDIGDSVYSAHNLKAQNKPELSFKQDIKPPASVAFVDSAQVVTACLEEQRAFDVKFIGEPPWTLDYELVHSGKRKKFTITSKNEIYSIVTPGLKEGGKQSIVLTQVHDKLECRTTLHDERVIEVRPAKPRAAFGEINGLRSIESLEGKKIDVPLRLKGIAPWTVMISNLDRSTDATKKHVLHDANAVLPFNEPGTYEIRSVFDSCPGEVDPSASTFKVSWLARPTMSLREDGMEKLEENTLRKAAVCQGDEDSFGLLLSGTPPYSLKYQQKSEPLRGPHAVSNKHLNSGGSSAFVSMDTSRAGEYTYIFTELGDERYSHDRKRFTPIAVKQQVYGLPAARFTHPGKTYGHCKGESPGATKTLPITLEGVPPFTLEIGITHYGSPNPEIVRLKDVESNSYAWKLARQDLEVGTHTVNIRTVTDSRGCSRAFDQDPSSVRIMVSDPPTIIPMEAQTDYCVGDHVSFSLSGLPPFEVFYKFQGRDRKAKVATNDFRRLAEAAGDFTIYAISDSASGKCRASKDIAKMIHPMPTVKISKGRVRQDRIQEGGEVDILFEFTGSPPFEFT